MWENETVRIKKDLYRAQEELEALWQEAEALAEREEEFCDYSEEAEGAMRAACRMKSAMDCIGEAMRILNA